MATPVNFVTRAQWGSSFDYSGNTRMPSTCQGVALHWEGSAMGTFTHDQCDNKVRSIEAYHVKVKGWAGIAYNALVCPHGYIFEGRGIRYRSAANGDPTKNNAYFAVCYIGGEGDPFTDAAKPGYVRAVQWLRADGGAGSKVIGHRDITSTACPGPTIEAWLKATNFSAGTTAPAPEPTPLVAVWGEPATWKIGSTGADVARLGERIRVWWAALGFGDPYQVGPGEPFSETDRAALSKLQVAWGFGSDTSPGGASDGFPGALTFTRLASNPPAVKDVTAFYMNAADYDSVGKGKRTRFSRTPAICARAIEGHPMWVLLVECAGDTLANREVNDVTVLGRDARMVGYKRVAAGGKGREAWYAKDAGITIVQSQLLRAQPELDGDDKPFLLIVWEVDGFKAVTVVFHNENQGTSVQKGQLDYVRRAAFGLAKSHGVASSNVFITGDANRKEAAADLDAAGMVEAGEAPSTTNMQFHSTNGWGVTTSTGRRIDVAAIGAGARWVYAKMLRLATAISDHNPFRFKYRITK